MMDRLPQERLKRNVVRGRLDILGELFTFFYNSLNELKHNYTKKKKIKYKFKLSTK